MIFQYVTCLFRWSVGLKDICKFIYKTLCIYSIHQISFFTHIFMNIFSIIQFVSFFFWGGVSIYCPLQPCRTMFYISCHDVSPQGIFMQGHIVLNQVYDILMSHREKFNINLSFYLCIFQVLDFKHN